MNQKCLKSETHLKFPNRKRQELRGVRPPPRSLPDSVSCSLLTTHRPLPRRLVRAHAERHRHVERVLEASARQPHNRVAAREQLWREAVPAGELEETAQGTLRGRGGQVRRQPRAARCPAAARTRPAAAGRRSRARTVRRRLSQPRRPARPPRGARRLHSRRGGACPSSRLCGRQPIDSRDMAEMAAPLPRDSRVRAHRGASHLRVVGRRCVSAQHQPRDAKALGGPEDRAWDKAELP